LPETANITADTTSDPVEASSGTVAIADADVSKPPVKRAKASHANAGEPAAKRTKIKGTETSRAKARTAAAAAEKVNGSKVKRSTHKGKAGR